MTFRELLDALTRPQRYNRRAASLVLICFIVGMSILQGPTTISSADEPISPLPGEQPKPTPIFVPLQPGELEKLNSAVQAVVRKSPVRIKAVTGIHHVNIDEKLIASLAPGSLKTGVSFQLSKEGPPVTVEDRKSTRLNSSH